MRVARVKKEKCSTTDCNRCIKFCPVSQKNLPVIYIGRNKKATVNEELCNGCAKCTHICPEKAIEMINIPDPIGKTATCTPTEEDDIRQASTTARRESDEEKIVRKKAEHSERVIRTLIACVLGMIAGIDSYFISGIPDPRTGTQSDPYIGIIILLVAIVLQRTIFIITKIDTTKLSKGDWFYQAFMTFSMWYLSWTIILSTSLLVR